MERESEGTMGRWGEVIMERGSEEVSHKALKFNKNTAFALNYFIPREKVRGKLL